MHDISYQYGFTEEAGNFQDNDFNHGGVASDSVIIDNDAPGENNAYFMTPPDGQHGQMAMFKWLGYTEPGRFGALENSIPIHGI
jgi:extracellular elastinolytic metalloproteinase